MFNIRVVNQFRIGKHNEIITIHFLLVFFFS